MSWKNKPYWLKGGIIGIAVWLILITLFWFNGLFIECSILDPSSLNNVTNECISLLEVTLIYIFTIIGLPIALLGASLSIESVGPLKVILFHLANLIFSFIYGSLIGLIIDKIKKRK